MSNTGLVRHFVHIFVLLDLSPVIRTEEASNETTYSSVDTTINEGQTQFNQTYVKSVSTEIVIDRSFT